MLVKINSTVWVNPDYIQSIDILCKPEDMHNDPIYWYVQIMLSDNHIYKSSAFKNMNDAIECANDIVSYINNKK